MPDSTGAQTTDVSGVEQPVPQPGIRTLVPGLMVAIAAYAIFWMWIFANAMSHSGIHSEWLLYVSGAVFLGSAGLFARSGLRAARGVRRVTWLAMVAFVLAAAAVFAGGLIALQPYFGRALMSETEG